MCSTNVLINSRNSMIQKLKGLKTLIDHAFSPILSHITGLIDNRLNHIVGQM